MARTKYSTTREISVEVTPDEIARMLLGEEYDANHQRTVHAVGAGGRVALDGLMAVLVIQFARSEDEAKAEPRDVRDAQDVGG